MINLTSCIGVRVISSTQREVGCGVGSTPPVFRWRMNTRTIIDVLVCHVCGVNIDMTLLAWQRSIRPDYGFAK